MLKWYTAPCSPCFEQTFKFKQNTHFVKIIVSFCQFAHSCFDVTALLPTVIAQDCYTGPIYVLNNY